MASGAKPRPQIGWREWVHLPQLGGATVKAKIDTGARTSAIHAFDIEEFDHEGSPRARFVLHPEQRNDARTLTVEAPLVDHRAIRPSSGREELRPIVLTTLELDGLSVEIELALSRRDQMGFRMLVGRSALRGRFAVDPARSYRGAESKAIREGLRRRRARRPIDAEDQRQAAAQ